MRLIELLAFFLLSGCALVPDKLRLEARHESHAVDHFQAQRVDYGRNLIGVDVQWTPGPFVIELGEGYAFHGNDGSPAPRELFEARIGYEIALKKP